MVQSSKFGVMASKYIHVWKSLICLAKLRSNLICSSENVQELRMARDRCQALTADLERSRADNVKLYEKMRFVQDYTQERPSKGRSGKKVFQMSRYISSIIPS